MIYTPDKEVGNFPAGSQFEGGESAYLCVFYGVADIAACSMPGNPVGMPWSWVDSTADKLANEVQGNNADKVSQGASLEDEYSALQKLHLTYDKLPTKFDAGDEATLEAIKTEIRNGKPVLLCAHEDSLVDEQLGKVPYHWVPTGNHCIVVTGYDGQGNLLVRDYAAVGNNYTPGSRRTYLAKRIQAVSATAVTPYWLTKAEEPAPKPAAPSPAPTTNEVTQLKQQLDEKDKLIAKLQSETPLPAQLVVFLSSVSNALSDLEKTISAPQAGPEGGQPVTAALSQFLSSVQAGLAALEKSESTETPPHVPPPTD